MTRARLATAADLPTLVEILSASHENYAWENWLLPGPGRLEAIERMMTLTTRLIALPHGEVWIVDDASAAVWLPPDPPKLSARDIRELDTTFGAVFGERRAVLDEVDALVRALRPSARHWTLGTMGTLPDKDRCGHGTTVMEPRLAKLDRDGECAALETSSESNVRFYERLGFKTVAFDGDLPHEAPPVWSMWRDPA